MFENGIYEKSIFLVKKEVERENNAHLRVEILQQIMGKYTLGIWRLKDSLKKKEFKWNGKNVKVDLKACYIYNGFDMLLNFIQHSQVIKVTKE